eukprot:1152081-Pelagomonas_calceolata.AAC.7
MLCCILCKASLFLHPAIWESKWRVPSVFNHLQFSISKSRSFATPPATWSSAPILSLQIPRAGGSSLYQQEALHFQEQELFYSTSPPGAVPP